MYTVYHVQCASAMAVLLSPIVPLSTHIAVEFTSELVILLMCSEELGVLREE